MAGGLKVTVPWGGSGGEERDAEQACVAERRGGWRLMGLKVKGRPVPLSRMMASDRMA